MNPSRSAGVARDYGEPRIVRRRSFDDRDSEELTMFHELRSFYDPLYRLQRAREQIVDVMRKYNVGMNQLLGYDEVDLEELSEAIEELGVDLRQSELALFFDSDDGLVTAQQLYSFLYSKSDSSLDELIRNDPKDPHNNVRLLRRDSTRFDPDVRRALQAFWKLVDKDVVAKDEYVQLHKNIYKALKGEEGDEDWLERLGREWEVDSRGKPWLNKQLFEMSIFQLADAWSADMMKKKGGTNSFLRLLIDRSALVSNKKAAFRWKVDPENWHHKLKPLPSAANTAKAKRERTDFIDKSVARGNKLVARLVPLPRKSSKKNSGFLQQGAERKLARRASLPPPQPARTQNEKPLWRPHFRASPSTALPTTRVSSETKTNRRTTASTVASRKQLPSILDLINGDAPAPAPFSPSTPLKKIDRPLTAQPKKEVPTAVPPQLITLGVVDLSPSVALHPAKKPTHSSAQTPQPNAIGGKCSTVLLEIRNESATESQQQKQSRQTRGRQGASKTIPRTEVLQVVGDVSCLEAFQPGETR